MALGLAAGLALVAALVGLRGPAAVGDALRNARLGWVGAAAACYAAFFAVRGARWRILLGPGPGWGTAALMTAAGWLVSTVVPMKAGDVLRATWMGRRHRAGVAAATGTVALERLLDLAGLAAVCLVAAVVLAAQGRVVPHLFGAAIALAWLLPGLGLAAVVALGLALPGPRRAHPALRLAGRALDQANALLHRPASWAPVAVLTAATTLLQVLVYVALVLALVPGADVVLVAAATPLFLLSFAVAVTPGHIGTYEAAFVLVFAGLGPAAGQLAAVAVALHLLTASLVAALGGLSFAALALARPASMSSPAPALARAPRDEEAAA